MKVLIFVFWFLIPGCFGGISTLSERNISDVVPGKLVGNSRPIDEKKKESPEIYIRKKKVSIERQKFGPRSGSLFNLDDPRNILLSEKPRGLLGSYIKVKIESNRNDAREAEAQKEDADGKKAEGGDELEDQLLKALPELDSAQENPVLIKFLKMKVVSQLENGDVLVVAQRASTNGIESNSINVRARVAYGDLRKDEGITSMDLQDVIWSETSGGELTERNSIGWEDEYTLRWSGFNEARSKIALGLDEKLKKLRSFRDQLQNEYKAMTKRRVEIAKERNRLSDDRKKILGEREDFQDKLQEKDEMIAEKDEQIKALQPTPLDEDAGAEAAPVEEEE